MMIGISDLGGAYILVRTSCGRVSATLRGADVNNLAQRAAHGGLGSLVEVCCSACGFNAFLLGLSQCLDVAIHGVLAATRLVRGGLDLLDKGEGVQLGWRAYKDDCDLGSHGELILRSGWWERSRVRRTSFGDERKEDGAEVGNVKSFVVVAGDSIGCRAPQL